MKKLIVALVSILVLVTVFATTSPASAPAFLLIVPFVAIFSLLFVSVLYVCQRKGWNWARSFRGALVGAGVPVVILVLQSIGQLTPRDMITISAIFLVLYLYLSRLSFAK